MSQVSGKVYFVSGIDTGIGKTIATGLMARWLTRQGLDVITVKMVQTGNDGFSEDLNLHRQMCGSPHFPEDDAGLTAPQIFKFPSSPLLAAALENRTVDVAAIAAAVRQCAAAHEIVLVESAGGLHVPLTESMLSIDLAQQQNWPLLLVTCGRLGSINHTLMSLEAAMTRRLPVAGVLYNWHPDADPCIDRDTPEYLCRWLAHQRCGAPVIRLPRVNDPSAPPECSFSAIFNA